MLECGLPESTSSGPSAAAPARETSTPSRSPAHSRPIASPTAFDMVAPVTNAPLCASLSPNSSRSHDTVSRSSSCAQEPPAPDRFWSNAEVSQSPATAAGVAPPVTKPR